MAYRPLHHDLYARDIRIERKPLTPLGNMPRKRQSSSVHATTKPTGSVADLSMGAVPQRVSSEDTLRPAMWRRAVYPLVPAVLAVITSLNALRNHFASDDLEQVLGNSFIKQLSNLPKAFAKSVWSFAASDISFTVDPYFRPIFSSLFTVNYALFGTSPLGWHLVNVLIHGAVTFLVFVVLEKLTGRKLVAALTASLFAVHPVHAESVAWVSGVTDSLMALLLLPAFYFYLRFRESRRWHIFGCALTFYFLALLTKETAIAFPLVIAYCEFFHFNQTEPFRQRLVHLTKVAGLFVAPTAIYFLMRLHALERPALGGQARHDLVPALLTIPLAIVKYLGLVFVPFGYSYQHYTEVVPTIFSISFLAPLALVLLIATGIFVIKSRLLTFATVWFIVMLIPALASLRSFETVSLVQERYLYVPSVGFCLALALGIDWFAGREWFGSRQRSVAAVLAVVVVLVWSLVLVRQNRVWDNTVSVYKNSVAVAPLSPMAHALLSRTYYDAGRPREAETEARTSLDLDSKCATAYMNLSYFANRSGKVDKACEYLENAIATMPGDANYRNDLATIYLNLGMLYGQRKMFDRAEQSFLRSIELSPRAVGWYYAGQFYLEQGRLDDALRMFERTLKEVPGWFAPVHLKLGIVYEGLGDPSRAQNEYSEYLRLAPDAPDRDDVKNHLNGMKQGATPANGGK